MKRKNLSSPRSARMDQYVPLIREFAARDALFHDAVARKVGLHSTDEKVLLVLSEDAMTAGDLVDYTGLTGAAVTALVDRLESFGYVTRERGSLDRRKVTIRAVSAKLREINRIYNGLADEMQALLSKYDSAEFAAVMDFLGSAAEAMARQTDKLSEKTKPQKAKAG